MKRMERENLPEGIAPFWFWNGDMKPAEIARQVALMKQAGVGGFFIHPRQGLTLPYLSEAWFERIRFAVAEAKKQGLPVWIYDEYPYPSGMSGGEVLAGHPEYEARTLEAFSAETGEGEFSLDLPFGSVVFARAYPVSGGSIDWGREIDLLPCVGICRGEKIFQTTGLTAYNRKRFFEGGSFKRLCFAFRPGRWRVFAFVEVPLRHMKFFGGFVDPLNREAVRAFIRTTHEKYRARLGDEFGRTVKGFFSDEIDLVPHGGKIRWSPLLPALFERRCGYSLIDRLPALVTGMDGGFRQSGAKVRYDYWNVMTDAFIESYDRQVERWCTENGLKYAAEKPVLRSAQLASISLPGCDAGHQKVGSAFRVSPDYRANPKVTSSAAHFYGKPCALCEAYHSVGWSMTLQDMKWMADWLAVQGVGFLVPHAFFYTTDGLAKHDAPPSSFFQQPYWKHMGRLTAYLRTVFAALDPQKRRIELLLIDPTTSRWTAMGESEGLRDKLAADFAALQEALLRRHFDYYIADPRLLPEFRAESDRLRRGKDVFRALVMPPMTNLEDEAVRAVRDFAQAGVPVFAAGCLPVERVDEADPCTVFSQLSGLDAERIAGRYRGAAGGEVGDAGAAQSGFTFCARVEDLPEALEAQGFRSLSVTYGSAASQNAPQAEEILAAQAAGGAPGETACCFCVNVGKAAVPARIRWRTGCDTGRIYEKEPETGALCAVEGVRCDVSGIVEFSAEFGPFVSKLFVCMKPGGGLKEPAAVPAAPFAEAELPADGWSLRLGGPNALRLGKWSLIVAPAGSDGPWADCGTVDCATVIHQVRQGGAPLPVKYADYFGCPEELLFPPLCCRYRAAFICGGTAGPVYLVMEPGGITGNWRLRVNGHTLADGDFARRAFYLPSNLAAEVTPYLREGENEIEVEVETSKSFDGLVNPLYLFGEFGVYRAERPGVWSLAKLPETAAVPQREGDGLPFFAGERILSRPMICKKDGRALRLSLPEGVCFDAAELFFNGRSAGVQAWNPFSWEIPVEQVLEGENRVELRVATTLLGLFEGQRFDYEAHRSVDLDG